MKVTVTLTDEIQPGSERVVSRLPTGQVMRFSRTDNAVTWSGELPDLVVEGLRNDGFDVVEVKAQKPKPAEATKAKGGKE